MEKFTTKQVATEMEQEYKAKFDFYSDVALKAMQFEDEELADLCVKRAAGIKMMLDYMPEFKNSFK